MKRLGLFLLATLTGTAFGFEDTKVLPMGVRNVNIRSINTDFDQATDNLGNKQPLSQPLAQDLTFGKIAKGESELKGNQLRAFLLSNGFNENESVGQFTADLKGHLSVLAPIVSYGVSDKLTMALAVPVYKASTSLSVGFQPNDRAQAFLNALSDPKNNQTASAREAAGDLNNAVGKLNQKLKDNGYAQLSDWQGTGLGDITVAGKYQHVNQEFFGVASTTGLVAPTGRQKDPDVLTDVQFGNGVWAPFTQLAVDEKLPFHFVINEYGKYTAQLPNTKTIRAQTPDEKIQVDYTRTRFKLGDMLDAGTSITWQPNWGLVAGAGYLFHHKYGDIYRGAIAGETREVLMQNSEQKSNSVETRLGYSTVPLYQAGQVAIPMDVDFTFTRLVASRNLPVTDLAQFDLNLYF